MVTPTGMVRLRWATKSDRRLLITAIGFVMGGALGNIIDRLRQSAVTDFIDLYWQNWHWPTFNGADIAITLGALLVFTVWLRPSKSKEPAF